ncbi:MAG TPA: nitrate reductase molybdenum cofactor assembly chaperone [Bacillota bacterium]|nr:nitrate reductase molybdenum cofactor assembly chaperone [Bacillota bacterium]
MRGILWGWTLMGVGYIQDLLLVCSRLLEYPTQGFRQELEEYHQAIEGYEPSDETKDLLEFFKAVEAKTDEELCAAYVQTFDFGKKTNLYITYAELGEERERGPALLELKQNYAKAGYFLLDDNELSDYLPVMLEFCSMANPELIKQTVAKYLSAIIVVRDELLKVESPYTHILSAAIVLLQELGVGAMEKGVN